MNAIFWNGKMFGAEGGNPGEVLTYEEYLAKKEAGTLQQKPYYVQNVPVSSFDYMDPADYDPEGAVQAAGGIPAFTAGLVNAAIQNGTNANGRYVKYADGTMLCTRRVGISLPASMPWGNIHTTNYGDLGNWPAAFKEAPLRMVTMVTSSGAGHFWMVNGAFHAHGPTTTSAGGGYFISGVATMAQTLTVDVLGLGLWK